MTKISRETEIRRKHKSKGQQTCEMDFSVQTLSGLTKESAHYFFHYFISPKFILMHELWIWIAWNLLNLLRINSFEISWAGIFRERQTLVLSLLFFPLVIADEDLFSSKSEVFQIRSD